MNRSLITKMKQDSTSARVTTSSRIEKFTEAVGYFSTRDAVFWLSAAGVCLLHLIIAWLPLERLEGARLVLGYGPLFDDSYFFFKLARDLAAWCSDTSYPLQLSSGFQPLNAVLYFPLFYLFRNDPALPIHAALSLNALIGLAGNVLLYHLLRQIVERAIAIFVISVWIWSPYAMNVTLNGMETVLSWFMLLLAISVYWRATRTSPSSWRLWFMLGAILGVGFWARVDLGLFGLAVVLDQVWLAIRGKDPGPWHRCRMLLVCGVTALTLASPWILFTFFKTGSLMPVSGQAVHQITEVLLEARNPNNPGFVEGMFDYFGKDLFIHLPLALMPSQPLWNLALSGLFIVGIAIAFRSPRLRSRFLVLWIFQVTMFLIYMLHIGGFWHLYRYFYPVYALMLFLPALALDRMAKKLRARSAVLALVFSLMFVPYALVYAGYYSRSWTESLPPRHLGAAMFARQYIPSHSVVGSFQSGCLSYHLTNQVVNLDGVINEEVHGHLKARTLGAYLRDKHVDYLVEEMWLFSLWDRYLNGQLGRQYHLISRKREMKLRWGIGTVGIYKRNAQHVP